MDVRAALDEAGVHHQVAVQGDVGIDASISVSPKAERMRAMACSRCRHKR